MSQALKTRDPWPGMGLASVVLGAVGLLTVLMPILCIPLAVAGLLLGLTGVLLWLLGGWTSLRWSLAGAVVSGLALTLGIAIATAPAGTMLNRAVPLDAQPVPERPYIAPPARPGAIGP